MYVLLPFLLLMDNYLPTQGLVMLFEEFYAGLFVMDLLF